jgi:hypothetical protein
MNGSRAHPELASRSPGRGCRSAWKEPRQKAVAHSDAGGVTTSESPVDFVGDCADDPFRHRTDAFQGALRLAIGTTPPPEATT